MFLFDVFLEIPILQIIVALLYIALLIGFIVFARYAIKYLIKPLSLRKTLFSKNEKYSIYSGQQTWNQKPFKTYG